MIRISASIFFLLLMAPPFALPQTAGAEEQYRKAMGLLLTINPSVQERDEALTLFRSAAEQKYVPAQTALGTLYERGNLATQDIRQAISWYEKAANQGDWIAQLALGRIYFLGIGISRDTSTAKKWLRMGADSGDPGSAFYLGLLNDEGQGSVIDLGEAAKWYRIAAEAGNPFAQQKLAILLLKGVGMKRDAAQAYTWLLVASSFGNHGADNQLQSMQADLGTTGANTARTEAAGLRQQVLKKLGSNECQGWRGQFSEFPEPPTLSFQMACENLKRSE
ncbi:MAG TPA: tetratricopeptide repeat protein [Candidatus Angelobacter sp.]|jgi:TPR repeat protein|nr:tetratricopeptide repeat protein [Candidatus Angelobacter sp.]